MSAELLRRAAEKLRKHANAATPGPWQRARYGTGWGVDGEVRPADSAWVAEMKFGEEHADAEYIALMHPPVALALAKMLEAEAAWGEGPGHLSPGAWVFEVARAILREEP